MFALRNVSFTHCFLLGYQRNRLSQCYFETPSEPRFFNNAYFSGIPEGLYDIVLHWVGRFQLNSCVGCLHWNISVCLASLSVGSIGVPVPERFTSALNTKFKCLSGDIRAGQNLVRNVACIQQPKSANWQSGTAADKLETFGIGND